MSWESWQHDHLGLGPDVKVQGDHDFVHESYYIIHFLTVHSFDPYPTEVRPRQWPELHPRRLSTDELWLPNHPLWRILFFLEPYVCSKWTPNWKDLQRGMIPMIAVIESCLFVAKTPWCLRHQANRSSQGTQPPPQGCENTGDIWPAQDCLNSVANGAW